MTDHRYWNRDREPRPGDCPACGWLALEDAEIGDECHGCWEAEHDGWTPPSAEAIGEMILWQRGERETLFNAMDRIFKAQVHTGPSGLVVTWERL